MSPLFKVVHAWISIVWVVCFAGVALVPGMRAWFMEYALHVRGLSLGEDVISVTTFVSGLIIWNVLAFAGVWLWQYLVKYFKA